MSFVSLVRTLLLSLAFTSVAFGAALDSRQAPNTGYNGDPISQTASLNQTSFVVPIKKTMASQIVGNRKLLPVKGLPNGYLKSDEHPLVISVGKLYDIRQIVVQIQQLQLAEVLVPFVDELNDGQTPFSFNRLSLQDQLVPVLAGSLQQDTNLQQANFNPAHDAFRTLDQGQFAMDINQGVPQQGNVAGAPVPNVPSFTGVWNVVKGPSGSGGSGSAVSDTFFKGVAQSPYVHTYNGLCSRTKMDFSQNFAEPFYVKGDLQAYPPVTTEYVNSKGVAGYHIVSGWNNEFGPGKACSTYKDFAASVKYE